MTVSLTVKRPPLIWLTAIVGTGIGLYLLISIFTPNAAAVGPWYRPFLVVSGIASIASMVGLLSMKRWSLTVYTVYVTLSQLILLLYGYWNISALVPVVLIFLGFLYYDQME